METTTLKEALQEWAAKDYTMMAIAIALGLMTGETNYQVDAKSVFWSNNPIGDMLHDFLIRLVNVGVLEFRENAGTEEFRWKPSFLGTWEEQTQADYVFPALEPRTLKESLSCWTQDYDSVQFVLAQSLGLMRPDNEFGYTKHVFWSDHPVGNMLYDFLLRLIEGGVLEYRETDSGDQFRWNPLFECGS